MGFDGVSPSKYQTCICGKVCKGKAAFANHGKKCPIERARSEAFLKACFNREPMLTDEMFLAQYNAEQAPAAPVATSTALVEGGIAATVTSTMAIRHADRFARQRGMKWLIATESPNGHVNLGQAFDLETAVALRDALDRLINEDGPKP